MTLIYHHHRIFLQIFILDREKNCLMIKKGKADPLHATEALGGKYISYLFSTSVLDESEWSASCPGHALASRKGSPGTHWTGGWVGPRASLDTEARGKILLPLSGIKPRSLVRPAHSQTLYWLSYPAHCMMIRCNEYYEDNQTKSVE
jgi:hypothetical protein